jgi:hypothetical protein
MRVRRLPALVAAVGLVGFGLVGCASAQPSGGACERGVSPDPAVSELVSVEGDLGEMPELEAYTPVQTDSTMWADVLTGEGTAIRTDDQLVVFDLAVFDGESGEQLVSTPFDGTLEAAPLTQWTGIFPTLEESLACAREGGRVVSVIPSGDLDEQTAEGLGLAPGATAIVVTDLRKVYLDKADGDDQFVTGHGMPTVVRAPDGRPGIIVPDTAPPSDLQVQVLKKGRGELVTGDAPVRVAYTGVLWDDRTVFDSTWDEGKTPASFELDQVVEGFGQALEGQTVGSQVLIVIPPELGYGDDDAGSIPGGSTLVFVVDILGIDAPAE